MPTSDFQPAVPRWYLIPPRILLVSFLVTLISFAVSLLIGIFGILVTAHIREIHPDMTIAYRYVAMPVAVVVGGIALITTAVFEIQNYRQTKTLAGVARASR
jgi:hypothetical protein